MFITPDLSIISSNNVVFITKEIYYKVLTLLKWYTVYINLFIIIIIFMFSALFNCGLSKKVDPQNDKKKTVVLNFSPVFTLFFGAQLRALIS